MIKCLDLLVALKMINPRTVPQIKTRMIILTAFFTIPPLFSLFYILYDLLEFNGFFRRTNLVCKSTAISYISNGQEKFINLQTLYLGQCEYISGYAFAYCGSLTSLYLGGSNVCFADGTLFMNTGLSQGSGKIYVPVSLVDAYKSANYWSNFSSRIVAIPE